MYRRGIINRDTLSARWLPDLHCIVVTCRSNKLTIRRPGNGPHKFGMPAIDDLSELVRGGLLSGSNLLRRHDLLCGNRFENGRRRPETRTGTLQEPCKTLCTDHESRAR